MALEVRMRRGRKVFVVVHCVLNVSAKVHPLAQVSGVHTDLIKKYLDGGVGLVQLPCPELTYLGTNRWGMTREQYDHACFRDHCEAILRPSVLELEALIRGGFEVVGVLGMDGSPNCGVHRTCTGFTGGELTSEEEFREQRSRLKMVAGKGVFVEVLENLLRERNLRIPFVAVDEENPGDDPS
jgi:predicted secreted protein